VDGAGVVAVSAPIIEAGAASPRVQSYELWEVAVGVGKVRRQSDCAHEYLKMAEEDERAATVLREAGAYRQAGYFMLQSMEKRVRAKAFAIVDGSKREIRELHRDHSVDAAIAFLMDVIRLDPFVKDQAKGQLQTHFIGDIRFRQLHNSLRYPYFDERRGGWMVLDIGSEDCEVLAAKLGFLKNFLEGLDRYR
jgi:hypothetical protein